MTRYTSLAYKRTHHEAGFDNDAPATEPEPAAEPAKKKQKVDNVAKNAPKKGWGRDPTIKDQAAKSEQRRQKRAQERQSSTVCFACRGKGHAAKDCPDANSNLEGEEKPKPAMGICYRCGATNHSLKRCRRPENPDDPLPFATCFVCGRKGHLAGGCAKNARGVYPDGGSCVLCGKTTHLARDCGLRKQPVVDHAIMAAEPKKALNPDEDDFHAFKRKQMRVEKALKVEEKLTKRASSANVASIPQPPKPKAKVVSF
ncbi:hypothetical protein AURDEDRAFT_181338 [Auricularia subglabra TFB-10046 SS5]|nr:hypothetical protein AURDEDRAFT_181338 [Auricularia subglabra TFB-10046 SS5]